MHPDLEDFLEDALSSIQPISPSIGRVVIEPDYDVEPNPADAGHIAAELTECLSAQSLEGESREIEIDRRYAVLAKYLRRITLHANRVDGPWIEVEPPGNWI
ncbi:MAG TPA: hypothetical protein VHZ55_22555 [Bryobacteraceae bacterium]|jgi:hypothetical protein|nr:hypothetical protein [Bryobacteraceae bacterium]